MAEIKAAIFDLDGTLYDKSRLSIRMPLNQLLHGKLFMLKREREVRTKLKGQYFGNEEAFYDNFFAHIGKKNARNWYFNCYLPEMAKVLHKHYHIAPWVEDTMEQLRKANIKIVIFSDYGAVKQRLDALGFKCEWADYIFDAPSFGGLKPCRESFLGVCEKIGIEPQHCIMVGDRDDTDGAGAKATGMQFVKIEKASKPEVLVNGVSF